MYTLFVLMEVNIHTTANGIWLFVAGKEYFLSYAEYPWFRKATLTELHNVEILHGYHLHWPDLDVDLDIASLENPEQYPLKSRK